MPATTRVEAEAAVAEDDMQEQLRLSDKSVRGGGDKGNSNGNCNISKAATTMSKQRPGGRRDHGDHGVAAPSVPQQITATTNDNDQGTSCKVPKVQCCFSHVGVGCSSPASPDVERRKCSSGCHILWHSGTASNLGTRCAKSSRAREQATSSPFGRPLHQSRSTVY